MAAPPLQRGGIMPERTFMQALANRPPPLNTSLPANPEIEPKTSYKGDIACIVTRKQAETLAGHYTNALVGKFSRGKPTMEKLNEAFKSVGFRGKYQLGSIDYRHVLIRFEDKDDYQRMWLKGQWSFLGASMKVLKWTVDFSPLTESSIVPVWITIRNVPIYFYNDTMIKSMGNQIGKFIKMDAATLGVTRPSAVKLCIEVDLRKKLPGFIRVGIEDEGIELNIFKLPIEYEDLPSYCTHCQIIGHEEIACIHLHPELKKNRLGKNEMPDKTQQVIKTSFYRPVAKKSGEDDESTKVAKDTSKISTDLGIKEIGDEERSFEKGDGSGLSVNEKETSVQLQQGEKVCVNPNPASNNFNASDSIIMDDNNDPRARNTLFSPALTSHRFNFSSKDDLWMVNKKIGRRSSPDRSSFSLDGHKNNRFSPLQQQTGQLTDKTDAGVDETDHIEITSEVSADAEEDQGLVSDTPQSPEAKAEVNSAKVCQLDTELINRPENRKNNFFTQLNKIMTPKKHFSPHKIVTRSSKSSNKVSK